MHKKKNSSKSEQKNFVKKKRSKTFSVLGGLRPQAPDTFAINPPSQLITGNH